MGRKIDKREARKRWSRGLGVALAGDRTFFNEDKSVPSSNYVTRFDLVGDHGKEWADFDYVVSQIADSGDGAISFAAPVVQESSLVYREKVGLEEVGAGDRIDVGAVGNWEVKSRTESGGQTFFQMAGSLGGDDGPVLRVRDDGSAHLLDVDGEPYSQVSDSVEGGKVSRRSFETDPTAVREKIAKSFPGAVFTEPMVIGRSFEKLAEHIGTYDCAPGSYGFVGGNITKFNSFDDPRRLEAVAVWEPNTTASSMVRG